MNLSIKNLKISGDNCDMMVIKYISGYHHDCDDDQEEDGGDKSREVGHPIGRAFHLVSNICICICKHKL